MRLGLGALHTRVLEEEQSNFVRCGLTQEPVLVLRGAQAHRAEEYMDAFSR
jgi:hypothetical protein